MTNPRSACLANSIEPHGATFSPLSALVKIAVVVLLATCAFFVQPASAGFSDGGDKPSHIQPNPNDEGGGGGPPFCGPLSVGMQIIYNGFRYQCTSGRGQWQWWSYIHPYGYFTGYPLVLDCPCHYWRWVGW